jgi:hypothetical protein
MFKRKRDWPIRVYQYWCQPTYIPDVVFARAEEERIVWNDLTRSWRKARYEADLLEEKDAKKARWQVCNEEAKQILANSPLGAEEQRDLQTRFIATVKRKGTPQYHDTTDHVQLFHRFTGGGMPVKSIFSGRGKRIVIEPVSSDAYATNRRADTRQRITSGAFGVGSEQIHFNIILHRPIPTDAIVKRVLWNGHQDPFDTENWKWNLNIMVEEPHPEPRNHPHGAIALDIGWRILGEGEFIRVAYLVDDAGRQFEIRLNLQEEKARQARAGIPSNYLAWREYDEQIGTAVEDCKTQVRHIMGKETPKNFEKARQSGLRRLLLNLEEQDIYPEVQGLIGGCFHAIESVERKRTALVLRLTNKRRHLYRNVAAWLTTNYREIVWEGDLRIKDLKNREGKKHNPALLNAGKYSQWAAPGELRETIAKTAAKNTTLITDGPTAGTTIICHRCSAEMQATSKLLIECPECGVSWDQDYNAGENLLKFSQTSASSAQENGLRKNDRVGMVQPIEIPAVLRAVVVPCSAE